MKIICNSCIHNRGGCTNRDEEGQHCCDWHFDYERLDSRDPSNWPDEEDFLEADAEQNATFSM